jgi:hypothetical protein
MADEGNWYVRFGDGNSDRWRRDVSLIEQFAERYGLKTRTDEDGTVIIPGRKHKLLGGKTFENINHIYEYDDENLGVMVGTGSVRTWNFRRKVMTELGMLIVQNGETEGAAIFDPKNQAQAKLAIREARVKPKRVMSAAQAKVLDDARKRSPLIGQKLPRPQKA